MPLTILICLTLFLHFYSDFNLQIGGNLHDMKQQKWWEVQLKANHATSYERKLYRFDWIVALFIHSTVWALVTFAPVIYLLRDQPFVVLPLLVGNVILHAVIDNAKANYRVISLLSDQLLHLGQIAITLAWCIFRCCVATPN